jgi:hypothetical protein
VMSSIRLRKDKQHSANLVTELPRDTGGKNALTIIIRSPWNRGSDFQLRRSVCGFARANREACLVHAVQTFRALP